MHHDQRQTRTVAVRAPHHVPAWNGQLARPPRSTILCSADFGESRRNRPEQEIATLMHLRVPRLPPSHTKDLPRARRREWLNLKALQIRRGATSHCGRSCARHFHQLSVGLQADQRGDDRENRRIENQTPAQMCAFVPAKLIIKEACAQGKHSSHPNDDASRHRDDPSDHIPVSPFLMWAVLFEAVAFPPLVEFPGPSTIKRRPLRQPVVLLLFLTARPPQAYPPAPGRARGRPPQRRHDSRVRRPSVWLSALAARAKGVCWPTPLANTRRRRAASARHP
jgi:hypothetical protein